MKKLLTAIALLGMLISFSCNDACKDLDCQNGGVCNEGICSCPDGFSGENCQFDEALCVGVNCLNSGVCLNGLCDCPEGFGGQFCETELPVQSLVISKLIVTDFPEQNGPNTWDGTDLYPDLRIAILAGGNDILNSSQLIENAQSNLSYEFTAGFPVSIDKDDFLINYSIRLEDEDGSQDELIANLGFSVNSIIPGRPSTINLNSGGVSIDLFLTYSF